MFAVCVGACAGRENTDLNGDSSMSARVGRPDKQVQKLRLTRNERDDCDGGLKAPDVTAGRRCRPVSHAARLS